MATVERQYRERMAKVMAEIESEPGEPRSPEARFRRFLVLMETMMPVIEALPRPVPSEDAEPPELGFYRRWRELEARRRDA